MPDNENCFSKLLCMLSVFQTDAAINMIIEIKQILF